jgi:very-short-patch-repair endonuclease
MAWAGPGAVLTGWAAAKVSFLPLVAPDVIHVALPVTAKRSVRGVRFERRSVPPELVSLCGGMQITQPCLTAVDLADTPKGGEVIDAALRTRTASLDQMWEALRLTPNRPGNLSRAQLLRESRNEPWSEAEREAHKLLRRARITGWVSNAPLAGYFVDILFARERVVLEIDGWETHGTRAAFEADRKRRNELELAGYLVLNFTWWQLLNEPHWVLRCVREALDR